MIKLDKHNERLLFDDNLLDIKAAIENVIINKKFYVLEFCNYDDRYFIDYREQKCNTNFSNKTGKKYNNWHLTHCLYETNKSEGNMIYKQIKKTKFKSKGKIYYKGRV